MTTFRKETSFNSKFFIGLFSLIALAASVYLTQHFYDVHFPKGIGEGGICDISSFLNCDSATNSPVSNILGAPISSFGIVTGLLFLLPLILTAFDFSGLIVFFGTINLVGCVGLLFYSLFALGSLCPVCSIFWITSNLAFYLSFKNLSSKQIKALPTILTAIVFASVVGIGNLTYSSKEKELYAIKDDLINQYKGLKNVPLPEKLPGLHLTETKDAPIEMIIFSDFQCPACKALSKMIPSLLRKYKNKLSIRYFFYPLDNACNSKMTYGLHPEACRAAKLSLCKKDELLRVHDEIFEHQASLDEEWLKQKAIDENVTECFESPEKTKELISIVDIGNEIGIKSTPTFLLNGKKIEGVLPLSQLYILMDSLL